MDFDEYVRLDNRRAELEARARAADNEGNSKKAKELMMAANEERDKAKKFITWEINLAKNIAQNRKFEEAGRRRMLEQGAGDDKMLAESWLAFNVGREEYMRMKQAEREKRKARARGRRK